MKSCKIFTLIFSIVAFVIQKGKFSISKSNLIEIIFKKTASCQIDKCLEYLDQTKTNCKKCQDGYYVQLQKLCVQQCQDYQYNDGIQCISCSSSISNCWKCTYSNSNISCTTCLNSYLLTQNSSLCYLKINNCKQYSQNYSSCQQCETNFTLSENNLKCLSPCDSQTPGYILIGTQCVQCSAPCQTCSKTATNCTSCISQNFYLDQNLNPAFQGEQTCQTICNNPLTSYVDQNQTCQPCSSSCLSCITNPYYCTSCYKDKFLQVITGQVYGICQSTCNTGFYQNYQANTCDSCSDSCIQCINNTQCTSCQTGYLLLQVSSTLANCVLGSSTQDGFYFDSKLNKFLKCSASCLKCKNSSTFCSSCSPPLLLDTQEGLCLQSCPSNKIQIGQECKNCSEIGVPNCNQCQRNGSNVVVCLSCQLGYYLNNGVCSKCDNSCKDCVNLATKCTLCAFPLVLDNNSCKKTCSNGKFQDLNQICQNCNTECSACFGQAYNCTSCKNTIQFIDLINPAEPGKYTCKNSCNSPITAYRDSNNYCQPCSTRCYQCSGSANNCISCLGKLYLQPSIDENNNSINICTEKCDITSYQDPTSGSCKACHSNCYSCSSSQDTNCTSCRSPNILTIDLQNNFRCNQVCSISSGYFMSQRNFTISNAIQLVPTCEQCSSACLLCEDNPTNCIKCQKSQSLYQNTCINTCPTGYYQQIASDQQSSVCQQCHSTCKTCKDSSQLCTTCIDEYFKGSDGKCYPCEFPCKNCVDNATKCTSCFQVMYFFPSTNSCSYSCDFAGGYYTSKNTNTCLKCDPSCTTCQDQATLCVICANSLKLQHFPDPTQNKCVQSCSDGYYLDNQSKSNCYQCSSICKTCSDQNTCLTCSDTQYLQTDKTNPLNIKVTCVDRCFDSFYKDYDNSGKKVCKSCPLECKTCTTSYDCQSCNSPYYLQQHSGYSSCQTKCDDGFIANDQNICQICTSYCDVCATATTCQKCKEDQNFEVDPFTGKCVCKSGYIFDTTQGICLQCKNSQVEFDVNCKTCIASDYFTYDCLTCNEGYYISTAGLFYQWIFPEDCDEDDYDCAVPIYNYYKYCSACNGGSLSNVKTCFYDSTVGSIVALSCIDGYYVYSDTVYSGICIKCHDNCLTCSAYTSCLTCQAGYFLDENNICRQYCFDKLSSKQYLPMKNSNGQDSCFYKEQEVSGLCIRKNLCADKADSTCKSDGTTCLICKTGYFLDKKTGDCLQKCNAGYSKQQQSDGTYMCININQTNCLQYDQYGKNCIQCSPYYFLLKNNAGYTQCVQSCPDGYFSRIDITLGDKCYKCSSNCKRCQYQSNHCLECDKSSDYKCKQFQQIDIEMTPHSFRADNKSITKQICVKSCPENSNVNLQTFTCFTCSDQCSSCQDSQNKCTGCKDGTFIFPLVYQDPNVISSPLHSDTSLKTKNFQLCLKSCSRSQLNEFDIVTKKSYYANKTSPVKTCQICPEGCITCNPSSDTISSQDRDAQILEYQCSECDTSLNYFSNNYGGCKKAVCGDGFRDANEKCDDGNNVNYDGCDSQCQIETGWSCTNNFGKNSLCKTVCGDSTIISYKIGGKETCDAGSSQGKVSGCSSQCTVIPGFFCAIPQNSSKTQCGLPCLGNCKKCSVNQDGVTSCIQCSNPNSFINGLGCVDQCQQGQFRNPITQSCQQTCPSLYASIDYASNSCVSFCPQNLFSINKQTYFECKKDCPTGYFKDYYENIQTCTKCHPSCSTCFSSSQTDCLSCSDNFLYHVHDFYNVCRPTCDKGKNPTKKINNLQVQKRNNQIS